MTRQQRSDVDISTKLERIANQSRAFPDRVWTTLAHNIDMDFLRAAFAQTRKSGAAGVDGCTAADYASNLDENLTRLHERLHSGLYRAPPVRRVYIPKGRGKTRPIGIPTIEDRVLQRAVSTLLSAVYEEDFLNSSYGFRPQRSAHQALETLRTNIMSTWGGYVVELDIESFFDSIDHDVLRGFLDKRIRDGVLRRTINKWLKAGVLEDGSITRQKEGSPQGGVISPLLANIYLHEVLDLWFEHTIKGRLRGRASLVRYADDAVIVFAREDDARRVFDVLPKRFAKFGLRLHPGKTRLLRFISPGRGKKGDCRPDTFDFLGFTHIWVKSRNGKDVVRQQTAKDRFSRALRNITDWCRKNRHLSIFQQAKMLGAKLRGHYGYYGITGNFRSIASFAYHVGCCWRQWLNRRSQRAHMPLRRFRLLVTRYPLPPPVLMHVYA